MQKGRGTSKVLGESKCDGVLSDKENEKKAKSVIVLLDLKVNNSCQSEFGFSGAEADGKQPMMTVIAGNDSEIQAKRL
ncbi:unnamed protein product [Pleuronectes platessa]|uniref:Uncharacterized protein n=1 Tax=Pleuronectes platessa TaxID=8262 RepID=A0A9N7V677_PLEPL|nr:unnamed protein product [Pleuronectes platessa]